MIFLLIFLSGIFFQGIDGEGMMYSPPGRSSVWRFIEGAPTNYNDMRVNCGGFSTQFYINKGHCGVCGDRYDAAHPQQNENTGTYGKGLVLARYLSGSVIDVHINLTANEKGSYNFSLCVLTDSSQPEAGELCFMSLPLENGSQNYDVQPGDVLVHNRVQLPYNHTCARCVLRWTYKVANNWGTCPDGTQALGCGDQEHFRACADIAIDEA